jgi:hypothetical protein
MQTSESLHIPQLAAQVASVQTQVAPEPLALAKQRPPAGPQGVPGVHDAQVPCLEVPLLTQLPLQHCASFLHFFPVGLQRSAAATPPSDPSAPPTRAAPINLSALRRVMLPLASALASSSKERLVVCWLTCAPIPQRAGLGD